jgi:hypothetical protein
VKLHKAGTTKLTSKKYYYEDEQVNNEDEYSLSETNKNKAKSSAESKQKPIEKIRGQVDLIEESKKIDEKSD